jgi:hypothetical protein
LQYVAFCGAWWLATFRAIDAARRTILEIHVVCEPDKVLFRDERFLERGYFDEALGHFECADENLNKIWQAGVETLRACTEDALVDNRHVNAGNGREMC